MVVTFLVLVECMGLSEGTVHRVGNASTTEVVFFKAFPSRELHRYDGFLPPRPDECIIVAMITTLFLVAGLSIV